MSPPIPRVAAPRVLAALLLAVAPARAGDVVASPYDPAWASGFPARNLVIDHDAGLTDEENGAQLAAAIEALEPGDQLEVGPGTWSIPTLFNVDLVGTSSDPIRIVAQPGPRPVLTRPNPGENVVNLGDPLDGPARYVVLRGFEVTGGADGVRLIDAENVWIDDCLIHGLAGVGIVANTAGVDASHLTLTRNEIHSTGGSGEGIKLGSPGGDPIVAESVIALNHVHDTAGLQGDGIEIGQGSWGNLVAENEVHDTPYPALLTYGTAGQPVNVVERNVFYRSEDVLVQVEAEAHLHDNLLVGGAIGFYSQQLSNGTRDIRFEHNTVVNSGRAVSLVNWNDKPGMFLVNNACYSESAEAVKFHFGDSGITIAQNAIHGLLAGASNQPGHFVVGTGLGDFEDVATDGSSLNARPVAGSVLDAAGNSAIPAAHGFVADLNGQLRDDPPEIGCYERDSWGCHYGAGTPGPGGQLPSIAVNGKPVLGTQDFVFFVKDAPPSQPAVLCWGITPFELPLAGGSLWLAPLGFLFASTDVQGFGFLNAPLPPTPGLDGAEIYFQWVISNPFSPSGWAFTEGLELELSAM